MGMNIAQIRIEKENLRDIIYNAISEFMGKTDVPIVKVDVEIHDIRTMGEVDVRRRPVTIGDIKIDIRI